MSTSTTSTCRPRSNARYSAAVSAARGQVSRSAAGSSAWLTKTTERSSAAPSAKRSRTNAASRSVTPIAAKTTTKPSSELRHASRLRDPGREFEPRQAVAGEDRQLLAAHERVEPVDRRDAGLDELGRVRARDRVDRQPVEVALGLGQERGPAVDRAAHAVEDPPDEVGPDGHARGPGADEHGRRREVEAAGPAEHLDDHPVALDLEHLAAASAGRRA